MSRYARTNNFIAGQKARGTTVEAELDAVQQWSNDMPDSDDVWSGNVNYVTAAGTANVITVTAPNTWTTYVGKDGYRLSLKITSDNTGAVTLNVDALGAKAAVRTDGTALQAADLKLNGFYDFTYNESQEKFFVTAYNGIAVAAAASAAAAASSATATAADRVQTGLDRTAAAASATSASGSEAAAAGSATSASGSATATAADRVQTGLDRTAAATSATEAAASATAIADSFVSTSTTSLVIGTGSKVFTTQANEKYTAGTFVSIASAANIANFMWGQVTSYAGTTLTVDVQVVGGSGTHADWNISLSGSRGAQGATGELSGTATGAINLINGSAIASAATINLETATGNRVHITGTTTITAVTLTKGPRTVIFDDVLTLTHHATNNNLPGAANIVTAVGDRAVYESDGVTVYCTSYTKADGTPVIAPTSLGSGGQEQTGSVTLTSSSPAMQSITTTAYGQSVTLPDATTMGEGVPIIGIHNAGPYPLLVKNSAGTKLGLILENTTGICALADNTTAAGVWRVSGSLPMGPVAAGNVAIAVAMTSINHLSALDMGSGKTLLAIAGASSLHCVVWDETSGNFGSPVQITAGVTQLKPQLALLSSTKALLVYADVTNTAIWGRTLDISGTTIAVNGVSSATTVGAPTALGDNFDKGGEMIFTGSAYVIPFSDGTARLVAATVSGNVVAFGAVVSPSGNQWPVSVYVVSSSQIMAFSIGGTTLYGQPYSISGATLTPGTNASVGSVVGATGFMVRQVGARWAVMYESSAPAITYGAIFSLSGTVASVSSNQLFSQIPTLNSSSYMHVVGNQVICFTGNTTNTASYINVITDSAGTAVFGTEIIFNAIVSSQYLTAHNFSSTEVFCTFGQSSDMTVAAIGISSNSPSVRYLGTFGQNPSGGNALYPLNIGRFSQQDSTNTSKSSLLIGEHTYGLASDIGNVTNYLSGRPNRHGSAWWNTGIGATGRTANSVLWQARYNYGTPTNRNLFICKFEAFR